MNRSIIYWKWYDETINGDLLSKIEDICKRTDIEMICIGLHWVELEFTNKKLLDAIKLCRDELHKRGRKIIIEVCPRKEGARFREMVADSPNNEIAYHLTPTEIKLDKRGKGEALVDTPRMMHYWRIMDKDKNQLLAAYSLSLYDQEALKELKANTNKNLDNINRVFESTSLDNVKDAVTISEKEVGTTLVEVDAGEEYADKTVVAFVGIPQPIPDLASDYLPDLFNEMIDAIEDIKVDGLMSDEWGYDIIFYTDGSEENDYYKKPEIYLKHLTYSDNFAKVYKDISGANLLEDILYFYYVEEGNLAKSISKVNSYHKAFRKIMRQNDEDMYEITKKRLGEEIFFGAHPTWWGNNYLQNFEGFKNGLYWWEAKRDIAQTDEIVIMPIRLSLAHKWASDIFYNMWYSMGTRDIKTYYRETWNNVRYGGRTHYLGYECSNEDVVLELYPEGMLESIEDMDAIVRTIDKYQKTGPDSRVLILFGMENSLNWFYDKNQGPEWYPRHKVFSTLLECVDKVFDKYLCDLVPTSEIENASLKIKDNKVTYGSQTYDAVVLLAPDSMNESCFTFLSKVDKSRLIVAGEAHVYDDGKDLRDRDKEILSSGKVLESLESSEEIIGILDEWDIATNKFDNGCVFQDGSLMFTSEGKEATNNPLRVKETYKNLTIDFEGEDMLYLHKEDGKYTPIYPKGILKLEEK